MKTASEIFAEVLNKCTGRIHIYPKHQRELVARLKGNIGDDAERIIEACRTSRVLRTGYWKNTDIFFPDTSNPWKGILKRLRRFRYCLPEWDDENYELLSDSIDYVKARKAANDPFPKEGFECRFPKHLGIVPYFRAVWNPCLDFISEDMLKQFSMQGRKCHAYRPTWR